MGDLLSKKPKIKPAEMTAAQVRAALRRHYAAPAHGLAFEVAAATGFDARRHIDAIAMDLWPSRGLALTGIEIKVSLGDFRREIKDPAKAEELAQYCDYFIIAAPKNLIARADLPMAWGLLEFDEDGSGRMNVAPTKTPAKEIGRPLLAAIMRASSRGIDKESNEAEIGRLKEAQNTAFNERVEREAERIAKRATEASEHWNALVTAIGEDPGRFWDSGDLIRAVKVVMTSGVARSYVGLRSVQMHLATLMGKLDDAATLMSIEPSKEFDKVRDELARRVKKSA